MRQGSKKKHRDKQRANGQSKPSIPTTDRSPSRAVSSKREGVAADGRKPGAGAEAEAEAGAGAGEVDGGERKDADECRGIDWLCRRKWGEQAAPTSRQLQLSAAWAAGDGIQSERLRQRSKDSGGTSQGRARS
jgi:hypothetical protein